MLRCLTVVILLISVAGGVLAYQVLGAPPTATPKATPTAVAAAPGAASSAVPSAQAAARFDQKMDGFQKSATAGGKQKVELTLTQQ